MTVDVWEKPVKDMISVIGFLNDVFCELVGVAASVVTERLDGKH